MAATPELTPLAGPEATTLAGPEATTLAGPAATTLAGPEAGRVRTARPALRAIDTVVAPHRRRLPARAQAYAAVRDAIIRCDLEPRQQLSENELGARLGMSRTPVREALVRLRDEGLVHIVPQLGTFVAPIDSRELDAAQFIREALECKAVRLAAERATELDVAALRASIEAQERACQAADFDAFYELDERLHNALCDLSGHAMVWTVSQRVKSHLNRVRRLSLPMPSYLVEMIGEHRAVVDAVAAHDPQRAEEALRHHLRMVLREVPRIRAEHPSFFEGD